VWCRLLTDCATRWYSCTADNERTRLLLQRVQATRDSVLENILGQQRKLSENCSKTRQKVETRSMLFKQHWYVTPSHVALITQFPRPVKTQRYCYF